MKYTTITENHLFSKAYAKGKRWRGRLIAVYLLPDYTARRRMLANPRREYVNRIGISTSKKLGNAVTRSRVRRIIRAGYASAAESAPMKKGNLIVIAARAAATTAKSTEVAAELATAFSALGLFLRGGVGE